MRNRANSAAPAGRNRTRLPVTDATRRRETELLATRSARCRHLSMRRLRWMTCHQAGALHRMAGPVCYRSGGLAGAKSIAGVSRAIAAWIDRVLMMSKRTLSKHVCHHRCGFSLLELVAVLAIIALLATIALPTYRQATVQVRRSEGHNALLKSMQQQEQIYTQRTAYLAFSATSTDPDARRSNRV